MALDYLGLAREWMLDQAGWTQLCKCSEPNWCSSANSFAYDFGNLRVLANLKNGEVALIDRERFVSIRVSSGMNPYATATFALALASAIDSG